jgi:hypothetical protein
VRLAESQIRKNDGSAKLDQAPLERFGQLPEFFGTLFRVLAGQLKLAIAEQDYDLAPAIS